MAEQISEDFGRTQQQVAAGPPSIPARPADALLHALPDRPVIRLLRFSPDPMLIVTLAFVIPALLPLAAPGYFFDAHDAHHSVFFLVEFDQAIRDRILWPVWGPDFALGFGYPIWLLYAPGAYYVAEIFHLLGLGFTAAVKATWALAFLIGAWGTFCVARRWWGSTAGLIAALAYTYAPYHLVQIYVRAALAEFVALAWFPWVLLALDALWETPRPQRAGLAALAFGGLLLTHTVSTLILVPLLVGFLLLRWLGGKTGRASPDATPTGCQRIAWVLTALVLGSLLAMVFILPMLVERGFVAQEQWTNATYDYGRHFIYPGQFLASKWGYGYSVPGVDDDMSFQLGLIPGLGAVVAGVCLLISRRHRARPVFRHRLEVAFLLLASAIAVFGMTPAARPLWDLLPLVSLIQFPWRLLTITTVTLGLLAGAAARWLSVRAGGADAFVYALALIIVLASFQYTRPELLPIRAEDESPIAVIEFETQYSDMRGMTRWAERLPTEADSPLLAQYLAGEPLRRVTIMSGQGSILAQRSAGASAEAVVQADTEIRLRVYWYFFPGWRATVDGAPVEIVPDPPNGLIGLTVPAGKHDVRLRFGATRARQVGVSLSLTALAGVLGLLAVDRRGWQVSQWVNPLRVIC